MSIARDKYDLIVVGSGPAGLSGAFFCAARGRKVLLLEKEKRFGGKLPISGGARCNVTNILSADEQAHAFGRKSRFLLPALKNFPPEMTRDFFKAHGVPIPRLSEDSTASGTTVSIHGSCTGRVIPNILND